MKVLHTHIGWSLGAAVLALVVGAGPALAQSGPSTDNASVTDENIVVTARKRDESIQDVPMSIQALGSEQLEKARVVSVSDLRRFSPNLNIRIRQDNTPDVSMRGVGVFGLTPGVGFYVNDVQVFEGQSARLDDVERVEVLKGPQGTLYGGSNMGGAIKYVTKRPIDRFEAQATAEYGSYETKYFGGMVSGPLLPGLNARLTGFYTDTEGFIYNQTLRTHADAGHESGARLTLAHDSENTTVTAYLTGNWLDTGRFNLQMTPDTPDDVTYNIFGDFPAHYNRKIYSGTVNIEHRFNDTLALTSISAAFKSKYWRTADADKLPIFDSHSRATARREVYSQELRLGSIGNDPFQWTVGAFFQAHNPDTYVVSMGPNRPDRYTDTELRSKDYAIFANATYGAGPWNFELGARYGLSRNKMRDPRINISESQKSNFVLPKASISYDIDTDVLAFASVSKGFTPGGIFELTGNNGVNILRTYNPETNWNYELGLKATFPGGIRFNVAAYYIRYKDRLYQNTELNTGSRQPLTVIRNVGPSDNYGIEMDLVAPLTRQLTLNANFGMGRAQWAPGSIFIDPYNNRQPRDIAGLEVPWAPRYQGLVGLDWTHEVGDGVQLNLNGDVSFYGEQFFYPINRWKSRPYRLTNVGGSIEWRNFRLYTNVTNLFDLAYNTSFIAPQEFGGTSVAQVGTPRTWTVGITFKY